MREEIKRTLHHKEHFYTGMAAVVAAPGWEKMSPSVAVEVASKATRGLVNEGDIWNAFIRLLEEVNARNPK